MNHFGIFISDKVHHHEYISIGDYPSGDTSNAGTCAANLYKSVCLFKFLISELVHVMVHDIQQNYEDRYYFPAYSYLQMGMMAV